ncbi:hypothetical protein ACIRCZ_15910 [Leifsonia sp. NPDC102414]|uniref:hypothetical protein n=1 Tax=Leifsonia sp. NPDC102414 TaxID=3364124 RepID=UPI00381BE807
MEATWLRAAEPPTWPMDTPAYRVRIWVPQPDPYTGWSVDDWDVTGATEVTEVIAWAEEEAARLPGGSCEVFVPAIDHDTLADGTVAEQVHHLRVYGTPADPGVTETVVSFRKD